MAQTWNAGICSNNFFNDNSLYYNKAGAAYGIDSRYSIVLHDVSTVKIFKNWVIKGANAIDMRSVTDSDTIVDVDSSPCPK